MFGIDFGNANTFFTIGIAYGGMVLAAFWLAMIIWTYRDMSARSRDGLARILVVVMVAVLNFPGLMVYLLLRPRETLSEAYERSLEEEALLQEIEEKATCPGCGQRVHEDWQVCAYCHTRLKKPCTHCGRFLELPWNICPHCTTVQVDQSPQIDLSGLNYNRQSSDLSHQQITVQRNDPAAYNQQPTGSLEFVDGDEY